MMPVTPQEMRRLKAADYARRSTSQPREQVVQLFATALREGELKGFAGAIEYLQERGQAELARQVRELAGGSR